MNTLQRYILREFLSVLLLCLFAATSLFLVIEMFQRVRVFVREGSTILQAMSYLVLKVPLIIHLMTPVAVLVATLISVGRLSQRSEITAMRACGASILSLAKPLLAAGVVVSVLMFIAGETIVPWATQRVEEVYHIDIRKRDVKGQYSKENFWYRDKNRFVRVGFYDSRNSTLKALSVFHVDDQFDLRKRIDAREAVWSKNPFVGWTMKDAVEARFGGENKFYVSRFTQLPLLIKETPKDFFNLKRKPETLSYLELRKYVEKLTQDGVPVTRYLVDLAAKISFPLVNLVVVLVGIPFALIPARSGNLNLSFIAAVTIGFGYYIVHAVSMSLGAAELIPIVPSAWTANILLGSIGGYLMAGAEYG